jgi:tetratricopeptide (TPR) repeat protein
VEHAAAIDQLGPVLRLLEHADQPHLTMSMLHDLAVAFGAKGDRLAAEVAARRALTLSAEVYGEGHPEWGRQLATVADTLSEQGRHTEAIDLFERALAIEEQKLGDEHFDLGFALNNLGVAYWKEGRLDEALARYERALSIWGKSLPEGHLYLGHPMNNVGLVHKDRGDSELARDWFERTVALWEKNPGPDYESLGWPLTSLGELAIERGDLVEARRLLERAWDLRTRHGVPPMERGDTAFALARLELAEGHPDRASSWAGDARKLLAQSDHSRAAKLSALDAWVRDELDPPSERASKKPGTSSR